MFRRTELSIPLLEQHPILLAANVSLDPPEDPGGCGEKVEDSHIGDPVDRWTILTI